jgi:hypothetical protein
MDSSRERISNVVELREIFAVEKLNLPVERTDNKVRTMGVVLV